MYESLTKHIPNLQGGDFGEGVIDTQNDGTTQHPIQIPYVNYSEVVTSFQQDIYQFMMDNRDIDLGNYQKILKENGIEWEFNSMNNAEISSVADRCLLALIMGAIRADRFSEGALLHFLESGAIVRWLERLKVIDEDL